MAGVELDRAGAGRVAVDQPTTWASRLPLAAVEEVAPVAGGPDGDVGAGAAELHVAVGRATAGAALGATDHDVVAGLAELDVVAEEADQDVVAGAAELDVGLVQALVGGRVQLDEGVLAVRRCPCR